MNSLNRAVQHTKVAIRSRRNSRKLSVFVHDVSAAAASFAISVILRMGDDSASLLFGPLLIPWLVFTAVCAVFWWFARFPMGVWRYTSIDDMISAARFIIFVSLIYLFITFVVTRLDAVPRSTLIINCMTLSVLLIVPRLVTRLRADGGGRNVLRKNPQLGSQIPILLVGVSNAADLFIREMKRNIDAPYHVIGLVAEDKADVGRSVHGRPILGDLRDLPRLINQFTVSGNKPQYLIITHLLKREAMQELAKLAANENINLARLPRLVEFPQSFKNKLDLQPVCIDDLLGRTQNVLNREAMKKQVEGQRVLVTGAGGSIGSELVRQVAALRPSHITLLDASEALLYTVELELRELCPNLSSRAILANVRDFPKLHHVVAEERPSVVFHAAALKHVPLVESNKIEGILTNTIGTRHVAEVCRETGVKAMVLISTDKAVNPANTMGASKRLAEVYCQALNAAHLDRLRRGTGEDITRYITVRFGNVLGSNGSVVPLFERQIAAGGPLTVTHPDVTRYFMTIREAVELVLQALALGMEESYRGDSIYVLDMGKPVKIYDLARQMISLSGSQANNNIQIRITGLRPGEKLSEELFHSAESLQPTRHPSLRLASPRHTDLKIVREKIAILEKACLQQDHDKADWLLSELVREFSDAKTPFHAGLQMRGKQEPEPPGDQAVVAVGADKDGTH